MRHKRRITWAVSVICLGLLYSQGTAQYSWQEQYVDITASGDFKWKPQPFRYTPGPSKRYVDYSENPGNDSIDDMYIINNNKVYLLRKP